MKKYIRIILSFLSLLYLQNIVRAQSNDFDIGEYTSFLNQHQNMTTEQLLQMHDAGEFLSEISEQSGEPLYLDSIRIKYGLTDYEELLLQKHGFVVTERLSKETIGDQFLDIFHKDLPVFISADAILYAFHSSYDRILRDIELSTLKTRVETLLSNLHGKMPDLASNYSSNPAMAQTLKDVDVFLTVPRKLLNPSAQPYYASNNAYIAELLGYIYAEEAVSIPFFSSVPRIIDFSQFKPRAHYASEEYPLLAKYFRAMMWLGRIELYLLPPKSLNPPTDQDVQRQIIDAVLISELTELSGSEQLISEIEEILNFLVGEQDNVTLDNLNTVTDKINLSDASGLLQPGTLDAFQDTLAASSFAFQMILSQILINDPMTPDSIVPASAFMMFGQRFIIDSYVTHTTTFDRILFNNIHIHRMLPSTLDILFSLGNDAAAQLLIPELNEYHYASNLAALRYLIDGYGPDFWEGTLYNMWLNSIRKLNAPESRDGLPEFMTTAAYWQEKMNAQLSGWAELRHDNLLYGKPSYTGGEICSFPFGYVEPFPEFYSSMSQLAELSAAKFSEFDSNDPYLPQHIIDYFNSIKFTYDTLSAIAQKELDMTPLSWNEKEFLNSAIYLQGVCGSQYSGWYPHLFYDYFSYLEGFLNDEKIVVDYHTAPTDEFGNPVGWVNHAGAGNFDLAIFTADHPDGETIAFAGPVLSYYELTTTNFLRLTDDEWKDQYLQTANRPDWVNLYLADVDGGSLGEGSTLLSVDDNKDNGGEDKPVTYLTAQNYPNPFNSETIINFKIPAHLTNSQVELTIYNVNGQKIKTLLKENLPSGNYLTKWNGTTDTNLPAVSGVYFYQLKVGAEIFTGKMSLLK